MLHHRLAVLLLLASVCAGSVCAHPFTPAVLPAARSLSQVARDAGPAALQGQGLFFWGQGTCVECPPQPQRLRHCLAAPGVPQAQRALAVLPGASRCAEEQGRCQVARCVLFSHASEAPGAKEVSLLLQVPAGDVGQPQVRGQNAVSASISSEAALVGGAETHGRGFLVTQGAIRAHGRAPKSNLLTTAAPSWPAPQLRGLDAFLS